MNNSKLIFYLIFFFTTFVFGKKIEVNNPKNTQHLLIYDDLTGHSYIQLGNQIRKLGLVLPQKLKSQDLSIATFTVDKQVFISIKHENQVVLVSEFSGKVLQTFKVATSAPLSHVYSNSKDQIVIYMFSDGSWVFNGKESAKQVKALQYDYFKDLISAFVSKILGQKNGGMYADLPARDIYPMFKNFYQNGPDWAFLDDRFNPIDRQRVSESDISKLLDDPAVLKTSERFAETMVNYLGYNLKPKVNLELAKKFLALTASKGWIDGEMEEKYSDYVSRLKNEEFNRFINAWEKMVHALIDDPDFQKDKTAVANFMKSPIFNPFQMGSADLYSHQYAFLDAETKLYRKLVSVGLPYSNSEMFSQILNSRANSLTRYPNKVLPTNGPYQDAPSQILVRNSANRSFLAANLEKSLDQVDYIPTQEFIEALSKINPEANPLLATKFTNLVRKHTTNDYSSRNNYLFSVIEMISLRPAWNDQTDLLDALVDFFKRKYERSIYAEPRALETAVLALVKSDGVLRNLSTRQRLFRIILRDMQFDHHSNIDRQGYAPDTDPKLIVADQLYRRGYDVNDPTRAPMRKSGGSQTADRCLMLF